MIVDRILKIIELNKITKSAFYKKTGLSNGFLDKVKDIGTSKLEYILNSFPEINPEWLITGKGSMLREEKGNVNQSITGSGVTMVGDSVSGSVQNSNGDHSELQSLEKQVKEYKKQLQEKDQEIKRLKNQIDKLFKLIP